LRHLPAAGWKLALRVGPSCDCERIRARGSWPTTAGRVIAGASVSLTSQAQGQSQTRTSNSAGIFVIFMTYDDAQSSLDHVHPHRTPLIVISPFAKPGYVGLRHYSTASVVKTEELLLGVPANNFGDLFATDLRDLSQSTYNGITADQIDFNLDPNVTPSKEGKKIWALVDKLDTSAPDRDSRRLGVLIRLSLKADQLHDRADKAKVLETISYQKEQNELYEQAVKLVSTATPADNDD
jgi:hypothetical protein